MPSLQKGFVHQVLIVLALLVLFTFVSPLKRYIYSSYQHLGSIVGLNFNNIATDKYVSWIKSQSDDLEQEEATFLSKNIAFKDVQIDPAQYILGETTSKEEKKIEVDLSEQRLYMKQGDTVVGSYLVSTGKWAPTPLGEWPIWIKLRYTRMTGGSKALGTFYDLPNVPYTMYYYQGYGIHGAYWHSNFGQPMSHGCVNMKPEEAGVVFNWAGVGTKVVVHE